MGQGPELVFALLHGAEAALTLTGGAGIIVAQEAAPATRFGGVAPTGPAYVVGGGVDVALVAGEPSVAVASSRTFGVGASGAGVVAAEPRAEPRKIPLAATPALLASALVCLRFALSVSTSLTARAKLIHAANRLPPRPQSSDSAPTLSFSVPRSPAAPSRWPSNVRAAVPP